MRGSGLDGPMVDRAVDTVVVTSGVAALMADIESAALIFSMCAGGIYYGLKAWVVWRHRDNPPPADGD